MSAEDDNCHKRNGSSAANRKKRKAKEETKEILVRESLAALYSGPLSTSGGHDDAEDQVLKPTSMFRRGNRMRS